MSFSSWPTASMDSETFAREFLTTPEKYGAIITPPTPDGFTSLEEMRRGAGASSSAIYKGSGIPTTATTTASTISAGSISSAKISPSSVLDAIKSVMGNAAFERIIGEAAKEMEIKSDFRKPEPEIDRGAGFGDW